MKRMLLIGCMVTCLWACRSGRAPQVSSDTATSTKSETYDFQETKDTSVTVPEDNSFFKALLECDSNGQVMMKQILGYQRGQHVQPPSVKIEGNRLQADCNVDSFDVYFKYSRHFRSLFESKDTTIVKTITLPPVTTNKLTWWQQLMIKLGYISTSILLLMGGIKIYKHYKP